jgi:hypothetical protein
MYNSELPQKRNRVQPHLPHCHEKKLFVFVVLALTPTKTMFRGRICSSCMVEPKPMKPNVLAGRLEETIIVTFAAVAWRL